MLCAFFDEGKLLIFRLTEKRTPPINPLKNQTSTDELKTVQKSSPKIMRIIMIIKRIFKIIIIIAIIWAATLLQTSQLRKNWKEYKVRSATQQTAGFSALCQSHSSSGMSSEFLHLHYLPYPTQTCRLHIIIHCYLKYNLFIFQNP